MNFKDLCELVFEEVNGRPLTFSSISLSTLTDPLQRRVVKEVKRAYWDILLYSRHWRFLFRRGLMATLYSNTYDYQLCNIQSFDWNSLYLTQDDTDARWPVYEELFDSWSLREQTSQETIGIPTNMIRSREPDHWLFWPIPNGTYYLNGNYQYKPSNFSLATDVPLWDEEYHELIAWIAVRRLEARVKTQDEIVSQLNTLEAIRLTGSVGDRFLERYFPKIGNNYNIYSFGG